MTIPPPGGPPPDGSRDRRIEDPTNLWLIHPASRALLPLAIRAGVSANLVSVTGLALGCGAAWCFGRWQDPQLVAAGLLLAVGWLIADGLDGMIARATGTASALGRFLDGICDHGVFILIYVAMALSIGTAAGWALAVAAGAAHIVQSSLFEGERARFHRRLKGLAAPDRATPSLDAPLLVRLYDRIAGLPDRQARRFERRLAAAPTPAFVAAYAARAVPAMRLQSLLSANMRVWLIAAACLLGDPRLFWWAELIGLSAIAGIGLGLHRRVEYGLAAATSIRDGERTPALSPNMPTRDR